VSDRDPSDVTRTGRTTPSPAPTARPDSASPSRRRSSTLAPATVTSPDRGITDGQPRPVDPHRSPASELASRSSSLRRHLDGAHLTLAGCNDLYPSVAKHRLYIFAKSSQPLKQAPLGHDDATIGLHRFPSPLTFPGRYWMIAEARPACLPRQVAGQCARLAPFAD
jgi:hypothetical protein